MVILCLEYCILPPKDHWSGWTKLGTTGTIVEAVVVTVGILCYRFGIMKHSLGESFFLCGGNIIIATLINLEINWIFNCREKEEEKINVWISLAGLDITSCIIIWLIYHQSEVINYWDITESFSLIRINWYNKLFHIGLNVGTIVSHWTECRNYCLTSSWIFVTRRYGALWAPTSSSCRGLVAFSHLKGPSGHP